MLPTFHFYGVTRWGIRSARLAPHENYVDSPLVQVRREPRGRRCRFPTTRNLSPTFRARAGLYPILQHAEAVPLDQRGLTTRTESVLVLPDEPGKIPCVHVIQSRTVAYLTGSNQRVHRCVVWSG